MKPGRLEKSPTVTALTTQPDILPGSNRAMLTLSDGSTIVLDEATNGSLASQGNIKVIKLTDGQLSYQSRGADENSPATDAGNLYNTITTPKGGQYQVVLPDSSVVWLNAASSLRFPVSFAHVARRTVELTGEAYFEIAKNTSAPFTVKHSGTEIQVLGTSFNVNAYADEDAIRTTLLEGSVKVVQQQSAVVLKPGQQASVIHGNDNTVNPVIRVQRTDTEDAVAWKNGLFVFNNADIQSIMRQISRWYDVEIRFEGKLPVDKFIGEVPRNSKVSEVLKIIELNNIHFNISGKTITLLP
jgi:ferric-dicitrate binding protein FerR (iron transport regulator)